MRFRFWSWTIVTWLLASCSHQTTETADLSLTRQKVPKTIQLQSSAFASGSAIPKDYTCDGKNLSPPLSWTGVPAGAQSLVLICEDPDAPTGVFTHWVLYNLAPTVKELKEGFPPQETVALDEQGTSETNPHQGKNDFGNLGYGGPCPPSGTHHYHFEIFALDARLKLPPGATKSQLVEAMKGRTLAQGTLIGTYTRSR